MTQEAHSKPRLTIGVLYGFRALMVLFVCNYHIWQQSWLAQQVTIFGQPIYFDFFTRSSYLFVDGMILLSGFLLYLPHAQAADTLAPPPDAKGFYWKRFMRIVPSYIASVLIMLFCYALPNGAYTSAGDGIADTLAHLTFTFTLFPSTYLYTPLNGLLWTIGIEVQFYIIFPLLARWIRRKPALTLSLLFTAGILFRAGFGFAGSDLSMLVNQMPAFLDVYALGMLGAILYLRLRKWTQAKSARRIASAISLPLFALGIILIIGILRFQSTYSTQGLNALRQGQWIVRLPLAVVMLSTMLSAAFMPDFLQKLLDNRLMRFLAAISLNLYIWHQILSVWLIKPLFPDTLHDDYHLQVIYTLLCFSLAILTAMALTYGLERPAAKLIQKLRDKKGERNHERPTAPKTV